VPVPLRLKECDVLAYVLTHRDRGVCGAVWGPGRARGPRTAGGAGGHRAAPAPAGGGRLQRVAPRQACPPPYGAPYRVARGGASPLYPAAALHSPGATTTLATVLRQRAHPEAMLLSAAPTARPHPMAQSLMCCGSIVDCWSAPHRDNHHVEHNYGARCIQALGLPRPPPGGRYSPHRLATGGSARGGNQAGGVGRETVQRDARPAGYRSGHRHRWQPVAALSGKGSSRDR
jgi:hypothetical protein